MALKTPHQNKLKVHFQDVQNNLPCNSNLSKLDTSLATPVSLFSTSDYLESFSVVNEIANKQQQQQQEQQKPKQHQQLLKVLNRGSPYTCEICGKFFLNHGSKTNHQKVHTGKKSYTCEICKKLFDWKCKLNKHLKVHNLEK